MKKIMFLSLLATMTMVSSAYAQLSIQSNGKEIANNEVIRYVAEENIFGEMEAGHSTEPVFVVSAPCKLEVSITIPDNVTNRFSWCGITHECTDITAPGTYTRVNPRVEKQDAMELHARFETGAYATCAVTVNVKVNDVQERTFVLEYVYADATNGIEDVPASDVQFTFAQKQCIYHLTKDGAYTLHISGLNGASVCSEPFYGKDGSVDLSSLPEGIYVYTVSEKGKHIRSGKFMIQ